MLALWASQVALPVKNLSANAGEVRDAGQSLGGEDPLEEDAVISMQLNLCHAIY